MTIGEVPGGGMQIPCPAAADNGFVKLVVNSAAGPYQGSNANSKTVNRCLSPQQTITLVTVCRALSGHTRHAAIASLRCPDADWC